MLAALHPKRVRSLILFAPANPDKGPIIEITQTKGVPGAGESIGSSCFDTQLSPLKPVPCAK